MARKRTTTRKITPAVNDNQTNHDQNPQIFTLGAENHFVKALAVQLLDEAGGDPLALSDYTIMVPNSTIGQHLKDAIAEISDTPVTILPSIVTPADVDEEIASLRMGAEPDLVKSLMDVPPAIAPLRRQILLASEILKMEQMETTPHKAMELGSELGRFLDDIQREGVDLKSAKQHVPKEFQKKWRETERFFKLLTETWPKILKREGMVDPEQRRHKITEIQAEYWNKHQYQKPVVVAGFSHPRPSERKLITALAKMPQARVLLPAINYDIDQKTWDHMTATHPQYGMKKLLDEMGVDRNIIQTWKGAFETGKGLPKLRATKTALRARRKFLSEVMRPVETAEQWSQLKTPPKSTTKSAEVNNKRHRQQNIPNEIDPRALTGMELMVSNTAQEEASIIALKMREALEKNTAEVALVTSDRSLARRVSARLRYWGIDVPDQAGTQLSESMAGSWLQMTANMASENMAPIALLECMKHPLTALGRSKEDCSEIVNKLEDRIFRGPRPDANFTGLKESIQAEFNAWSRRRPDLEEDLAAEQQEIEKWVTDLEEMYRPFMLKMQDDEPQSFAELLDLHIQTCEAMAASEEETGAKRLWAGVDGMAASNFLSKLREMADDMPDVTGREYQLVLESMMRDVKVKPKATSHPQLKIMSPEQARLVKPDLMIVAGLNENSWPQKARENFWLSRTMMQKMGMESVDHHIGQSAHDFVQSVSTPNVMMLRSRKSGDAPTVPSPFLMRIMMVTQGLGIEKDLQGKSQLAEINAALQTPGKSKPISHPEPRPPANKRPKKLPVTSVELFLRDPYALYAKYILKLRPKEQLDSDPSYSERGMFIHDALERFVRKFPDELPENAQEELLEIGRESFKKRNSNPAVRAFWWPRFERIAKWFIEQETARRDRATTLGVEVEGELQIDTGNFKFILTAIADRIDILDNDRLSIIDYKTGGVPTQKSIEKGFSPQMTLEALIAETGGFDEIDANDTSTLEYWKLSGGRPAGKVTLVKGDIQRLQDEALEGLYGLISTFSDEKTPYLSAPRPGLAPRFNNYRHLSRSDEWGRNQGSAYSRGSRMKPKSVARNSRRQATRKTKTAHKK